MDDGVDWKDQAKRLLRAEMTRRGVTTSELAARLGEHERTVSNKIVAGSFSAAWMLKCFSAIGVKVVTLE